MAANRIKGITIEIGGNTTKLQAALKDVNGSLRDTQGSLKDVERLLKMDPGNVELLRQKQKLLSDAVRDTSEKLKTEREALEQLKEGPQTGAAVKQQEALTREIADTEGQLKSLTERYRDFGSVAERQAALAGEKMRAAGESIRKAGERMSSVGGSLAKLVTAPVLGAGASFTAMASNFEDAMAKVSTIADETEVPMKDMKSAIMELSDQTGISAAEIADNVYNAISAGQKTGDAVNFVSNAAMLAKAGFTDSASALDILTTAMNAYGMEADEVTRVSDVLIQTQNLGKTTVGELASAMGKVIPTAKSNGVQLEDLAGAYAVMTANGIATAETTTYLNSMLNELGKQGTTAADAFAAGTEHIREGGLTMAAAMESGWELTDVLSVLDEQAAASGTSIANMFGSAEAGKAANVLWDNATKLNDAVAQMEGAAGSTRTAFEKLDTSSYETQIALNQLKNTGIGIGTMLLEMAQPAIEMLSQAVSGLKGSWDSLNASQQEMIIKCAGVAAAAGPVISIGGKAVSTFGSIVSAGSGLIGTLSSITSRLGGLASGAGGAVEKVVGLGTAAGNAAAPVTSAGSAVGTLSQNALGFVAAGAGILLASTGLALLAQSAVAISDAGPGAAAALLALIAAVAGMAAGAAALAPALTAGSAGLVAFGAAVTLIGTGVLAATSGVAGLGEKLPAIAEHGTAAASALAQIGASLAVLAAGAVTAAAGVTALLVPFAGAAVTIGLTDAAIVALAATLGVSAVAAAALTAAMAAADVPVKSIEKDAKSAGKALEDMVTSVNVVSTSLNGLKTLISDAASWFAGMFTKETPNAVSAAQGMAQKAMDAMKEATDSGMSQITSSWASAADKLDGTAKAKMAAVEKTMEASLTRVQQKFSTTGTQVSSQWEKDMEKLSSTAKTKAEDIVRQLSDSLKEIRKNFSTSMDETGKAWDSAFKNLADSAKDGMSEVSRTVRTELEGLKQEFSRVKFSFSHDITLPHFKMRGSFDPESGEVPHVSVSWYRKAYDDAYLLDGATIFGAMNGKLLGGGEGGKEMVVGADKLMAMIREAAGSSGFTQNLTVNAPSALSPSEVARQTRLANRQMVLALRGI